MSSPQIINCQDADKEESLKNIADKNKVVRHKTSDDHWSDTFIERVHVGQCPICGNSLLNVREIVSVIPPSEIVCFDTVAICAKHPRIK